MSAAHSKKSRFLLTDDDWMTAVLSCANCHPIIESWTHEAMEKIVLDTIARRGTIE